MEVYAYGLCSEAFTCHPDWRRVLVHPQSMGMGHQHVGEQPCRGEKTLTWAVSEDAPVLCKVLNGTNSISTLLRR